MCRAPSVTSNPYAGIGGSLTGNTLSGIYNVGIAVTGFRSVEVQNNRLNITRLARLTRACPLAAVAIGPAAVSAGTIQPPPTATLRYPTSASERRPPEGADREGASAYSPDGRGRRRTIHRFDRAILTDTR
jgi:hypothetical protein